MIWAQLWQSVHAFGESALCTLHFALAGRKVEKQRSGKVENVEEWKVESGRAKGEQLGERAARSQLGAGARAAQCQLAATSGALLVWSERSDYKTVFGEASEPLGSAGRARASELASQEGEGQPKAWLARRHCLGVASGKVAPS